MRNGTDGHCERRALEPVPRRAAWRPRGRALPELPRRGRPGGAMPGPSPVRVRVGRTRRQALPGRSGWRALRPQPALPGRALRDRGHPALHGPPRPAGAGRRHGLHDDLGRALRRGHRQSRYAFGPGFTVRPAWPARDHAGWSRTHPGGLRGSRTSTSRAGSRVRCSRSKSPTGPEPRGRSRSQCAKRSRPLPGAKDARSGLGGVFRVESGGVRSHVVPDYDCVGHEYYDAERERVVVEFLRYFEPRGAVGCSASRCSGPQTPPGAPSTFALRASTPTSIIPTTTRWAGTTTTT